MAIIDLIDELRSQAYIYRNIAVYFQDSLITYTVLDTSVNVLKPFPHQREVELDEM